MKKFDKSCSLFEQAQRYLPGGVDSPVRAYRAVGGSPPFIVKGKGSKICDADGNRFIDFVCSWGPLILGHAHPAVVRTLRRAAGRGTSYGAPTALETKLAEMIIAAMPSIEMLRFVSSGTEAAMTAARLARAFTGRDRIIKFAGGYHGHADGMLVSGGSGLATLGLPASPGVPQGYAENTLVAPYNDSRAVELLLQSYPGQVAAVIVEPVAANMGLVLPRPGFLPELRRLTQEAGVLLIFDEVITGFRLAYGGAQSVYGVKPDLTCLGKIIGGGLPVGAFGGRRDIMQMMAPEGPVYQAGTLSGNPLAMTAGIEVLSLLGRTGFYQRLEETSAELEKGLTATAKEAGVQVRIARAASLLTIFFTSFPVIDYDSAKKADTAMFSRFFHALLQQGVYWPPSQFEAAFVSSAHNCSDIRCTVKAAQKAFRA